MLTVLYLNGNSKVFLSFLVNLLLTCLIKLDIKIKNNLTLIYHFDIRGNK